jgi:hypothetical protein
MRRRAFLGASGVALAGTLAGCSGLQTRQVAAGQPPVVGDRPDAVYVPSHIEGMQMVSMAGEGRRRVGLMFSYPHRFWTITGTRTKRVSIQDSDSVHLMASVFDAETNTVLPVGSGLTTTVERDGETVDERDPWPMLSQNMGFHYGDNVALQGDGTYTVTVDVGSVGIRRYGAFAGEFEDSLSVEFELDYRQSQRDEISYRRLDEEQGQRGSVDSMADMMTMPLSFAPERSELPGRVFGEGTSGDAVFLATATERDGEPYLAVSPRTPHNRYVLPLMALSATVERDGETVFDDALPKAIDPELDYHYGAPVEVRPDDTVTVSVDSPPQVSRHEGYETAFVEMDPLTFEG